MKREEVVTLVVLVAFVFLVVSTVYHYSDVNYGPALQKSDYSLGESGVLRGTSCGNGVIDSGEECDPEYFGEGVGTMTCGSLGYSGGGTITCSSDCRIYLDCNHDSAGCPWDLDQNTVVNPADRGLIGANIPYCSKAFLNPRLCARYDLDGNGVVNPADRGYVTANLGADCSPSSQTHGACSGGVCVSVIGEGTQECTESCDYQGPSCQEINGDYFGDGYNNNYYETDVVRGLDIYGREYDTVESCSGGNRVVENYCDNHQLAVQLSTFSCDLLGRDCVNGKCVFRGGFPYPEGYIIDEISACNLVDAEVIEKARGFNSGNTYVSLVEGDRVYHQNYVVVPEHILKLVSIDSNRARFGVYDISDDYIIDVPLFGGSSGSANLDLFGTIYTFQYSISSSYENKRFVTFDFPQTSGNDRYEFYSCL